jgi:hypothetical protein
MLLYRKPLLGTKNKKRRQECKCSYLESGMQDKKLKILVKN